MAELAYPPPFPLAPDATKYRLFSKDGVSVTEFEGEDILKVDPEVLTRLAREAMRDASFLLRPAHLEQVAAILDDPEASNNDRGVALAGTGVGGCRVGDAGGVGVARTDADSVRVGPGSWHVPDTVN